MKEWHKKYLSLCVVIIQSHLLLFLSNNENSGCLLSWMTVCNLDIPDDALNASWFHSSLSSLVLSVISGLLVEKKWNPEACYISSVQKVTRFQHIGIYFRCGWQENLDLPNNELLEGLAHSTRQNTSQSDFWEVLGRTWKRITSLEKYTIFR